jgi:hypothetical protein
MERHSALYFIWAGVLQGVGVEFSFFLLWMIWRVLHGRVAHRFHPEHFFHQIHEYFK